MDVVPIISMVCSVPYRIDVFNGVRSGGGRRAYNFVVSGVVDKGRTRVIVSKNWTDHDDLAGIFVHRCDDPVG